MRTPLGLRAFTQEEKRVITKLSRSQTASARLVERAKILYLGSEGQTVPRLPQLWVSMKKPCASGSNAFLNKDSSA